MLHLPSNTSLLQERLHKANLAPNDLAAVGAHVLDVQEAALAAVADREGNGA